jgi:hypothetical protein
MRSLAIALLLIGTPSVASADFLKRPFAPNASAKLMAHLLQDRVQDQRARPIGSCVFSCGDRLVEVERCPNGECPTFDCNARVQACPAQ